PLAVVIAGGADTLVLGHRVRAVYDAHPLGLRLARRFDRFRIARIRQRYESGDVLGLLVKHVSEVRRQSGLGEPHVKAIRKTVAQKAVESPHPLSPVIGQRNSAASVHSKFGPPRVRRTDLEAGGEDQTIDFVFDSADHDSMLCYSVNP